MRISRQSASLQCATLSIQSVTSQGRANETISNCFQQCCIAFGFWLLAACSIQVSDKDKDKQKVDIQTPIANLKVDTSSQATDNGIPVYPGAKPREADKDGDKHRANVNIGGLGFGLKVIAAEYVTPDSPEKVKAFYEDKLKSLATSWYVKGHSSEGDVTVHGNKDDKLTCKDSHGRRLGAENRNPAQPAHRRHRTGRLRHPFRNRPGTDSRQGRGDMRPARCSNAARFV